MRACVASTASSVPVLYPSCWRSSARATFPSESGARVLRDLLGPLHVSGGGHAGHLRRVRWSRLDGAARARDRGGLRRDRGPRRSRSSPGSAAEADLVAAVAARFGAAFESRRAVVAAGPDLEARARRARYAALPRRVDRTHRRRPGRDRAAQPPARRGSRRSPRHGRRRTDRCSRVRRSETRAAVCSARARRRRRSEQRRPLDPAQPRPARAAAAARCDRRARRRARRRPPGVAARRRGRGARRARRRARPDATHARWRSRRAAALARRGGARHGCAAGAMPSTIHPTRATVERCAGGRAKAKAKGNRDVGMVGSADVTRPPGPAACLTVRSGRRWAVSAAPSMSEQRARRRRRRHRGRASFPHR